MKVPASSALTLAFERKLHLQLSIIGGVVDEAAPFISQHVYTAEDGAVARIRTHGDALRFLNDNAQPLAERESEALSLTMSELQFEPDDGVSIDVIVERWPWTPEGRIHRPDLRLPSLLEDVMAVARARQHAFADDAPHDVCEEEVTEIALSTCPQSALVLTGSEPMIVSNSWGSSNRVRSVRSIAGRVIPDVRQSAAMLALPSRSSGRAFVITKRQVMWLYATTYSAEERRVVRGTLLARSVIRGLASVARGGAERRLIEVVAPAAIHGEVDKLPDQRALRDVANAVRDHVEAFNKRVTSLRMPGSDCDEEETARDLDSALAEYVANLGEHGRQAAKLIRERAFTRSGPDLWRLWRYEPSGERYLKLLARVAWSEQVQPARRLHEHRPPAIVRATAVDRLLPAMRRQIQVTDDGTVRDERRLPVGEVSLTTEATLAAVRRGMDGLGTVTGNLLIRGLIHRANAAWNSNGGDPRRVVFEGGWSGLLEELGIPKKNHTLVKEIAIAGQCVQWTTPHVTIGGLWTWNERRGTKAIPGEVAFVLGDALAPGCAVELARKGNSPSALIARRLVPELRYAPPVGRSREREHGRIWTLHRLMLVELVDNAEELHAAGGVAIPSKRWRELADQAGLPLNILSATLDAWVEGDDETAPALLVGSADSWTLAEPHAPERDFIAAGGAERTRGRQAAKSARRRRRGRR